MKPTVDILRWAAKHKRRATSDACPERSRGEQRFIVGFALEDKNLRANAQKKLKAKNLDMIIANSPESIAADESAVQVKTAGGKWL